MEFITAGVLLIALVGATEAAKRVIPVDLPAIAVQAITFVLSISVILLARESVWAHTQVIGDTPLDQLDLASVAFAALIFSLGANTTDRVLKSVASIGENNGDAPR